MVYIKNINKGIVVLFQLNFINKFNRISLNVWDKDVDTLKLLVSIVIIKLYLI